MNKDFPRLIKLLREEKNLSQKKAAEILGISQALLSHYERGIRECGLDFIVGCANLYGVSADYLLGLNARRGDNYSVQEDESAEKDNVFRGGVYAALGKALATDSLSVLFELVNTSGNKELASDIQKYVSLCIYNAFRYYYSSSEKNNELFFSTRDEDFPYMVRAAMSKCELNMKRSAEKCPDGENILNYDKISSKFPKEAPSILNIIKNTENLFND